MAKDCDSPKRSLSSKRRLPRREAIKGGEMLTTCDKASARRDRLMLMLP